MPLAEEKPTGQSHQIFSRALFVLNPKATNAARSKKLWRDVVRILGEDNTSVVDLSKIDDSKTRTVLVDALKNGNSKTLLCVGGGDGTVGTVITTIVLGSKQLLHPENNVILPLWGGNANDMAVMLNGLPSTVSMPKILKTAECTEIYPLKIVTSLPGKRPHTYIAGCYASFGATAEALARMEQSAHVRGKNGPRHKLTRLVNEFRDVGKTFFSVRPIKLSPDQEKTVELYDRIFINGSRYAKILRSPIDLHERRYFVVSSREKNWWYFALRTLRPLAKKTGGKISDRQRSFTVKDETYMQVDGEVFNIHPNTHVSISISSRAVTVLETKLTKNKKR